MTTQLEAPPAREAERAYDVAEAAAVKRVSEDFIHAAIKATGKEPNKPPLKAKRVGRYLRIRACDLDEWFDSLPDA